MYIKVQSSEQLGSESLGVVRAARAVGRPCRAQEALLPGPARDARKPEEYRACGNGGGGPGPEALAYYAGAGGEVRVARLLYPRL